MTDKIMIIDAFNQFIRNFICDPSLGKDGYPFGGCKGFLKSLQKEVREVDPKLICIVWDGAGGSKRKKKMFAEYKDGRAPVRLNRNIKNLTADEEENNKKFQFLRTIEYLNDMPVIQLMIDDVEADDVISRICSLQSLKKYAKVIISSDRDFIQLCAKDVILKRPIQDEILNVKRIVEKYGIHPNNFALARSIAGDSSDNLPGIGGAQLKTISKRFPFLSEEKSYTLTELYDFSEKNKGKIKVFENVLENKNLIELNYKMMQLYVPNMSPNASRQIKETFDNFIPEFNQTEVIKKMARDGITDYNWKTLFDNFKSMTLAAKEFKRDQ